MATKPDSESGWIDKCPYKADAGDEYYFVRHKDRNDVLIMGFSMGKAWLNGVSYEPSDLRSHLFLGPLFSPDFEQLQRLRKACEAARDWLAWWVESEGADIPDGVPSTPEILAALREALTHTGEAKQ